MDGRVGKRIDWKEEGGRVYVVLTTLPCSSARQLLPSLFPPSPIPFDGLFIHLSPSFDREEGRRAGEMEGSTNFMSLSPPRFLDSTTVGAVSISQRPWF